MTEKRKFSVAPEIIYHLVVAQAGSLAKAVLECVMNSVDAGATAINIKMDSKSISIIDDGQGFKSRKEIEDWFEVFGFPHEEGSRTYGKFGIGRAQLWSFCSTVWRTTQFEMRVDIKKSGLDYDLVEGLPVTHGVAITGLFYDKQSLIDQAAFEREFADLAKYAQIPVNLNGKQVNKDPSKETWDFDTKDAWIRLKDNRQLFVYNQGVLVRQYHEHTVGTGGTVVTKPGVKLALNMARNDILVSECPVWKRLKPMLQKKADARRVGKTVRLSEAEIDNLSQRFISGTLPKEAVGTTKFINDITGRGYTLEAFRNHLRAWSSEHSMTLTVAEEGSVLGDTAHRRKLAFVLAPAVLGRFNVETVAEFLKKFSKAAKKHDPQMWECLSHIKTAETLREAVPTLSESYEILDSKKDLTDKERSALRALSGVAMSVAGALIKSGVLTSPELKNRWDTGARLASREIHIGKSESAQAWTDGIKRIVFDRKTVKLFDQGIGGAVGLINIMVHEYLHNESDAGSHVHDLEFYTRYHEATCGAAGILNQAASKALDRYLTELKRLGKKVNLTVLRHADGVQRAQDLTVGQA